MTLGMGEPDFPVGGDSASIADWAELYVIARDEPLRRGSLGRIAEREGGGSTEVDVDTAWSSLVDRAALHGTRWPLSMDNDLLAPVATRRDVLAVYAFLCALSLSAEVTLIGRRLFEHCVTDLMGVVTGGPTIRFGSPRAAPVPTPFDAAIAYYALHSEEKAEQLSDPDYAKDLDLDVVAWFPFSDRRGSYLHLVGQCATGGQWRTKTTELNMDRWHDHMQWAVGPARFFAIPRVILTPQELRRISLEAGLVLDRPRLLELCVRQQLSKERTTELEWYCRTLYPPQ